MLKPIKLSIDTVNDDSKIIYNNIRKGDTLKLTISVYENSANLNLTGQTMHIVLQKSDGYAVEKIINSVTGNTFVVDFDVQATLAVGEVEGIIEISDINGTDITNIFNFEVKENPSSVVVIKSSDQIETLSQIVGLINSYNANADNLAAQNVLALQNKTDLTAINNTSSNLHNELLADIATGQPLDVALKDDITIGQALDVLLKATIGTGNAINNTLLTSIANGIEVVAQLANADWDYVYSMFKILEEMINGSKITDENSNYFTDENGNYLTM